MSENGPPSGESTRQEPSNDKGIVPGIARQAAFSLALSARSPIPVLIAVPHAGRIYPPAFADTMRHPHAAALRLEDRFVDLLAAQVARETGAGLLVAQAPRAMIDLNRSPDDVDWDMIAGAEPVPRTRMSAGRRARSGLGLVPRRLPGLGEIWRRRLKQEELTLRIDRIHRPYHAALADSLEALRDRWGSALLIDLHSMPPLGPKRGPDASPDFVVGDRFGASCDSGLSAAALDHLAAAGQRAAHNRPYAGGYVLDRHAAPARGVHGMQIEVCRSIYLDDSLREPGPGMAAVARVLAGLVRRMALELAGRSLPQAAE
ncbi:MAG: N-formylglutamate amidohydrolase [Croceibacterium sp.]